MRVSAASINSDMRSPSAAAISLSVDDDGGLLPFSISVMCEKALAHAGFCPGSDRFVYAGDLVDRGPDAQGCLELVERYATEVLLGNRDLAVLLDFFIHPQAPESRSLRPLFIERVLGTGAITGGAATEGAITGSAALDGAATHGAALDGADAWKVAVCVDDVLVTHGGVSSRYERVLHDHCDGDPVILAAHLNQAFFAAVRCELQTGEWDTDGILGDDGPLWFRPPPYSRVRPLADVRQVVGHTPPQPGCDEALDLAADLVRVGRKGWVVPRAEDRGDDADR